MDGKPLKEWIVSENVHPDLTIENHRMWSTGYQVQNQFFLEGALAYYLFNRPIPAVFTFKANEMWDNVTKALMLWDGDIMLPTGQDWGWKVYTETQYVSWMRNFLNRPEAGAYESRALQMTYKRQLAVGTGSLGALDFGYNTAAFKRWSFSYLGHKYAGRDTTTSMADAYEKSLGAFNFPHVNVAIHRAPNKVVSVSYHSRFQPIYVFPEGDSTFTNPPFFVPYDREGAEVVVKKVGEALNKKSPIGKVELIDLTTTDSKLKVIYNRQHRVGVTQKVGVVSLPDEATLIVTEFTADRPGTYSVEQPFKFTVDSIEGFPKNIQVSSGDNWLNWTNHLAFVSTNKLPSKLGEGTFFAAEDTEYTVKKGESFGRLATVVYTRQSAADTEKLASTLRFVESPADTIKVTFKSSTGTHTEELAW